VFEIKETVAIEKPVEAVWSFVIDEANEPLWQTTLAEVRRLTDGPMAAGTRVLEVRRFLGRKIETVWEMVECDPPRRSAIRSVKAPFAWQGTYELGPADGGMWFTVGLQGDPGGFFRVAEPVFARMGRRELVANLANLKDVLEAGVGETAAEAVEAATAS